MARQTFKTFGEYLQKLRETRDGGWTQEDVEIKSKTAISREYVSLLERGLRRPSPQMCQVIARVFRRPVKEVLLAAQSEMLHEHIVADIRPPEGAEKVALAYEGMNDQGRERLLEYVDLLARDPKYTK